MDSLAVSESYLSDSGTSSASSSSRFRSRQQPLTSASFTAAHPAPALPPHIPARVLHRLVAGVLVRAGFEAAQGEALDELEGVVAEVFGSLVEYAHALAELGRRHVPNAVDVLGATEELGVGGAGALLRELERAQTSGNEVPSAALQITYARPRAPTPPGPLLASDDEAEPAQDALLASPPPSPPLSPLPPLEDDDDDEDAEFEEVLPLSVAGPGGVAPKESAAAQRRAERAAKVAERAAGKAARLAERERRRRERARRLEADPLKAPWLPDLPPKHSWKQTPVYPQSAPPPPLPPPISQTQQAPSSVALAHLSTLRARRNDSQLVSSSLRNLIRSTRGTRELGEGDSADVVDYEGEWYGAAGTGGAAGAGGAMGAGGGVKRRIRVLTVGGGGSDDEDALAREEERERGRKEAAAAGGALGGGGGRGAGKRRRWLV